MAKKSSNPPIKVDSAELLEHFRALVPAETYACILSQLDQPLPQAFRINKLQRIGIDDVKDWSERYRWEIQPVPFCDTGWQVLSAADPPSQTVEHSMGAFYIQEASSMLPPELFTYETDRPELVLDMAASPGGKTTHLIDRLGDRGLVVANDASRTRIQALRLALERWGAINATVTCQPGELFGNWYPDTFDKVLIDAPCSMEGLRTAESHPMRPITQHERESLVSRQLRLVTGALRTVRPGGQVVYSTCTLAPEEDEAVLGVIKRRYGPAIEILAPNIKVAAPAIQIAEVKEFPEITRALRIWPHLFNTAGFFAALIQKNTPIDPDSRIRPPLREWSSQGWVRLNKSPSRDLTSAMQEQYGFDLNKLVEQQQISFWKRDDRIWAIPDLFLERFLDFPVVSCGIEVGNMIDRKYQPSHEWASRFAGQFTSGRMVLPADQVKIWLQGSDIRMAPAGDQAQVGMICLMNDYGQFIGRGKVLAGRVKNLLPRRLVG